MKFSVASEHRNYFQNKQTIEFEALLSSDQTRQLVVAIETVLSKRLNVRTGQLKQQQAETLFLSGHDLWRQNDYIKRIATQPRLAEIASELIEQKKLRLGYDQYFPFPKQRIADNVLNPYADLLLKQPTLKDISSVNGLLCGLMLCLNNIENEESPPENPQGKDLLPPVNLFSKKAGHGVYFSPEARIDFRQLLHHPEQNYLLIVYTQQLSQYILTEADPHTHSLKRLGLVFGDKLTDKLNPIVCR